VVRLFFPILLLPALVLARPVPAAGDSTVASRYARAVELFFEHDDTGEALDEAVREFTAILILNPQHAPSLSYLAMAALENEDAQAADSLLTLAVAADSACPEAHVARAQWHRRQGAWQEGLEEARRAVQFGPANPLALRELVNELLHRAESPVSEEEVREAIPRLRTLIGLDADDRDAHYDLAQAYEQLGEWQEAGSQYGEVLRIGQTPDDMDVWVYQVHGDAARCLERAGDDRRAAEELRRYLDALREYQADDGTIHKVEEQLRELEERIR
jgi:tetratricopeptide (TPR) repeat protein